MVLKEVDESIPVEILAALENATCEVALLAETVKVITTSSIYLQDVISVFCSKESVH